MPTPVFIEFVGPEIGPSIPSLLEGDIISADADPILEVQMGEVVMRIPKIVFAQPSAPAEDNDNIVVIVVPTGVIDGVNTAYTTPDDFEPDSLEVYVNGVRQGQDKFSVTGNNSFEMTEPIPIGEELTVQYSELGAGGVSMSQIITGEIPVGAVDGVNATYTTAFDFDSDTLQVSLNGLRMDVIDDYIITGPNEFVFNFSPGPTEELEVDYIKA